jgi:hypothetical protein
MKISNGRPPLTQRLNPLGVQQLCQGTVLLVRVPQLLLVRLGVQNVLEEEITHFRITEG